MKIKISRKRLRIKLPKKRIKFERFLLRMGIRDRSVIIPPMTIEQKILEEIYPNLNIQQSMRGYANIKSYVYEYFNFIHHSEEQSLKLYNKLIKINHKSRVAEQIWSLSASNIIRLSDKKLSKKILYSVIQHTRKQLSVGICGEFVGDYYPMVYKVLGKEKIICIPPKPYDILVSKPSGEGIFSHSIRQIRKKSLISRRIGFGKIDENCHQYVFYDENLKLNPIDSI